MSENNYQQNGQNQYYQNPDPQQNQPQYYNQVPNPGAPMAPQEEKASVGLAILSFIIPIAGLIIFLSYRKKRPKTAKVSGICALVSFILGIVSFAISGNNDVATNVPTTTSDSAYTQTVDETQTTTQNDDNSVQAESDNANDNTLGDYGCVVKSATVTKDWTGEDAVLITYEFTNNSSDAISFDVALDARAYQDGIGLETAILDEDTDLWVDVDIKPGVTKEVRKAYVLRDTTTPVEIEVSEWISFSDDKIVTTIEL